MAGATINLRDAIGTTALTSAACLNHYRNGEFLIAAGADIENRDRDGDTPLLEAVRFSSIEMIGLLINSGARTDGANDKGLSILHLAASYGDLQCALALARFDLHGARIDSLDWEGKTPRTVLEQRISKDDELEQALFSLFAMVEERQERDETTDEEDVEFVDAFERLAPFST